MSYIQELRKKYPEFSDVSDGDLLMVDHQTNYPDFHIKEYLSIADPNDKARFTISKNIFDDYKSKVSQPLGDESDQDRESRLYGNTKIAPPKDSYDKGIARSAIEGATLGLQDEIVGGASAAIKMFDPDNERSFSENYDKYKGIAGDRYQQFSQENPKTSLAAEILPSIATGAGLFKAGATATKALPAAGRYVSKATKGLKNPIMQSLSRRAAVNSNKLGRVGSAAVDGALYGGAVRYNKDQDILDGGAVAMDAALGGAGQRLGEMLPSLVQTIKNSTGDAKQRAASKVRDLVNYYGLNEVSERMRALGGDAVLADVLGSSGGRAVRTASDLDMASGDKAKSFFMGRSQGQNQRIIDDMSQATGADPLVKSEYIAPNIYNENVPAINEAYEKARALGSEIKPTPKIEQMVQNIDPSSGAPINAQQITDPSFADLQQWEKILKTSPDARAAFSSADRGLMNRAASQSNVPETPDLNMLSKLDLTKRRLDGMASAASRSGRADKSAEFSDLARNVRGATDEAIASPAYAEARQIRKNVFDKEEAVNFGIELANGKKNFKDIISVGDTTVTVRQRLGKTNNVVEKTLPKEEVLQGFGARNIDMLGDRKNTANAYNNLISDNSKKTYQDLMGENSSIIDNAIKREQTFNATKNQAIGGPNTAQRLLDAQSSGVGAGASMLATGAEAAEAAATGGAVFAGRKLAPKIKNAFALSRSRKQAPYEMDYMLSNTVPSKADATPQGVVPEMLTGVENALKKKMIQNMLGRSMIYTQNSGGM